VSVSKLVGGVGVIAVLFSWAYIALTGEPRLQIGVANGAYSNRCCGSVVLNNGVMTVANQHISYVIEQDKAGPYVLPKGYVGASQKGFVVKPDAFALKLRLDDRSHPRKLELIDDKPEGATYPFVRGNGS